MIKSDYEELLTEDKKVRVKKGHTTKYPLIAIVACLFLFAVTPLFLSIAKHKLPLEFNSGANIQLVSSTNASSSINVHAKNVYVLDLSSDTVLFEHSAEERIAPASTTKLLTSLTVLDNCTTDEMVTVGEELSLVAADASKAHIKEGQILSVHQLLEALLLPSGNDAAYTLANYVGQKIEGTTNISTKHAVSTFVNAMNKKAKSLGARNSHFASPDGYDAPNQYTTAKDLSIFARNCLANQVINQIVNTYQVNETLESGETLTLTNTNLFLDPDSKYYDDGVVGLKTGSSDNAGYCLVCAKKESNHTYLSVLMNSTKNGRFDDTKNLYKSITEKKS